MLEDVCIYNTNVWISSGTPTAKEWVSPRGISRKDLANVRNDLVFKRNLSYYRSFISKNITSFSESGTGPSEVKSCQTKSPELKTVEVFNLLISKSINSFRHTVSKTYGIISISALM